ncbi:MAG TPA: MlaD family protein [Candidatus Cloacimonadota bacterium]|jgi:phospholipid/cholesterol/gamma-HCH transport system substrate-binding protein|nr:MlaD family protein [Candidatus Cloacimonadota bacterium]HQB40885.1 MlaD family protein [Candidatus Cloacimonadota bacterium]
MSLFLKDMFFKDRKKTSFKVGAFTAIVIFLFVISYSYLNDLIQRHKYTTINVLFDNINNLEPGNSVTVNGFKKGRVEEIKASQNGIITTLFIDLDFPLKQGTLFIAKESDIMGNHQIDILPGDGEEILNLSELQIGFTREGFTDLIYRLNTMAENVDKIFSKLENADDMIVNINGFIENSSSVFKKIDKLLTSVNPNQIKSIVHHLNSSTKEINDILHDNKDEINLAIRNSNTALTNINNTISIVDSAMVYLTQVSKSLADSSGTAGAMINDKELYNNLLKTSQKVDSLLIDIKKNPRKYFKISVF